MSRSYPEPGGTPPDRSAEPPLPVDDGTLAALARSGDSGAFTEVVRRWLAPVYDLCAAVEGEATAAAATQETVARAISLLANSEGREFGPWLLGLARAVLVEREGTAPVGDDLLGRARRFGARRQTLLHLHLRQGYDTNGIASVLGIGYGSADRVLARLVPAARAALDDGTGADPIEQYRTLPETLPPDGLADSILAGVLSNWRGPVPRARAIPDPSFIPAADWVAPAPRATAWQWRLAPVLAVVAAGFSLLLLLPASPIALTRERTRDVTVAIAAVSDDPTDTPTATPRAHTPTPTATSSSAAVIVATETPTAAATATLAIPSPTPTPIPTATATPTATEPPFVPTPTATPTATSTPRSPTATPTQCPSSLYSPTERITIGSAGRSSFIILNNFCGAATFTVDVLVGSEWLDLSPHLGTISSGSSVLVNVVATATEPGLYQGQVVVSDAAGNVFLVNVSYTKQ